MPEPQTYCALPWCGASKSGATHRRKFRVEGRLEWFVYPAEIDMHDIVPRGNGGDEFDLDNNVPLCHECHMKHHNDGRYRLTFEGYFVYRADGLSGELVLGDRTYLDEV